MNLKINQGAFNRKKFEAPYLAPQNHKKQPQCTSIFRVTSGLPDTKTKPKLSKSTMDLLKNIRNWSHRLMLSVKYGPKTVKMSL